MADFGFKRTGDEDYPRYLKVLLQGPPKSGKTTFLSTAPNVVVAACEAGLMSIAHLDIPYVDIDSTDKLQRLEMILRDDTLRAQAAKSLGLPKIESVAIDTLDAWQDILKKEILRESKRDAFQQADWGTLKERMSAILKRFVTLPLNVIFTVHTSTTQDDEQRMVYAPALQGSIKDEIAGYVDFSLLSFRQRETAPNGQARISYYLKNEGDLKNPHLGNRAAGRVPEICAPQFSVLHDAVFKAVKSTRPQDTAAAPEAPAQTPSQPAQGVDTLPSQLRTPPAPKAEPKPKPAGVPADDPNGPINAPGKSMLTKSYVENGLTVPPDLSKWTLGQARTVARWFTAWKADEAAGKKPTRDDLIEGLKGYDAFAGEMEGVQTGTDNLKKAPTEQAPAEVQSDQPETDQPAVAILQSQLGAVVIGHEVASGAKCDECGQPVDDTDIANLALNRFRRALCVKDYKAAVKATKN